MVQIFRQLDPSELLSRPTTSGKFYKTVNQWFRIVFVKSGYFSPPPDKVTLPTARPYAYPGRPRPPGVLFESLAGETTELGDDAESHSGDYGYDVRVNANGG